MELQIQNLRINLCLKLIRVLNKSGDIVLVIKQRKALLLYLHIEAKGSSYQNLVTSIVNSKFYGQFKNETLQSEIQKQRRKYISYRDERLIDIKQSLKSE